MKIPLACLFVLISCAGRGAEPAAPGEEKQTLDGRWDFTIDSQAAAQPDGMWNSVTASGHRDGLPIFATHDMITVPGNWDVLPPYATYQGKGWYRRIFQVPASWQGKHLRLRFDAVNYEAHVSLNGVEIGSHVGGYTPFEFDVTGKVVYGGNNTLVVCADNSYQRGAWWHWGGISRDVTLFADNDVRIVWQHITAVPDLQAGTAQVSVRYRLANTSETARTVRLHSEINVTLEAPAAKQEKDVELPAKSETEAELSFSLPRGSFKLWDFDHPNLCTLNSGLLEKSAIASFKRDDFGIRKVEVNPDGLYLNGEKVRLCGFNRVSDSNRDGNTEPDALVHGDIDLMKRCGAEMSRLMHYPQAPNLLDYLDEKGMLIFEEIPVWGSGDPNVKMNNPLTEQWLKEMIDRDYNHPCIIGWSMGNEISGHYAYVKSMQDYVRQNLDSSRLLTYVSNTAAGKGIGPSNDPATVSDPILLNSYNWFDGPVQTVRQRWPDKPIFFSEWGFRQFGANLDARIPGFAKGLAKTVQNHPYLIGLSLWTFNDYRSGFKGTPPSGNREWGVVDVDRRPKAAYEQVREAFSPVHALTVGHGEIRIEPRSPDEVPSYALRGYQLHWRTLNADGSQLGSGVIPVPDLKPGDAPWQTPCAKAPRIEVGLFTPTGYDVADSSGQP